MKKNKKILYAGGLVLFIILAYGIASQVRGGGDREKIRVVSGEIQDFEITIPLSGTLTSSESINVVAPLTSKTRTIIALVSEGTIVKKGDVIAQFDTAEIEDEIYELEVNNGIDQRDETKAEEDAKVLEAEAGLENAKEKLKVAEINFQGLEFAAALDRQKGVIELNKAKAEVRIAENRLERAKIKRKFAMRAADRFVATQARKLEREQAELESFTMRAPSDGMLVYTPSRFGGTKRKVQNGDSLWKGQIFLEIPNLYEMEVEVEIPEESIRRFSLKDSAKITLDAFPNIAYKGFVSQINQLAVVKEENPFIRVFRARIRITDVDIERLRPGMNAQVDVMISSYKDAFSVPLEALHYHEDGRVIIYLLRDGEKIEKRAVTLVDQTIDYAILTEDLSEEAIIVPTRSFKYALKEGKKENFYFEKVE